MSIIISIILSLFSPIESMLSYLKGHHKKFRSQVHPSFLNEESTTSKFPYDYLELNIYNDNLTTEMSKLTGIFTSAKRINICRFYINKHRLIKNNIYFYPYSAMLDVQNTDEIENLEFVPIKSHETRKICLRYDLFITAVTNTLYENDKALKNFVNNKDIFVSFVYETITGKTNIFSIRVNSRDVLGSSIDIEECKKVLQLHKTEKQTTYL
ncbi:hypothetical protein [Paucilactobacillus nenjiangensis]|uniref:hypothetical protein n=1 Tax=Paucilactobacillus nenjiangensis TaxID=1296540 RepID=UPI003BB80274